MEIVEADERAELDRRVDGAADRHGDHRVDLQLRERAEVRPVRDVVGEPHVARAVTRHVGDLDAGERARA